MIIADDPKRLSSELRRGSGGYLRQRRAIVAASLIASSTMSLITLYQTGIIRHLPEPPLPKLDADAVDAAPEAYTLLSTPDATLGLASYAATTVLASMAGKDRHITSPWIPLLLALKVLVDALAAAKLTVDQWTKHRAFCFWCLVGAMSSFVSVPLVIPEARAAVARIRSRV